MSGFSSNDDIIKREIPLDVCQEIFSADDINQVFIYLFIYLFIFFIIMGYCYKAKYV